VIAFNELVQAPGAPVQTPDVAVQRWTGTEWQPVGGTLNAVPGGSVILPPGLAVDGNDRPVVALVQSDGAAIRLYLRRANR
jgi:hypothetical protein